MSKKRLDLQMFADASAQLQNTTGAAGMTAEMKTYYEKTCWIWQSLHWCMTSSATVTRFRRTTARPLSSASMMRCPRPPRR